MSGETNNFGAQVIAQGSKVIEVEPCSDLGSKLFVASVIDSETVSTHEEVGDTPQAAVIALMLSLEWTFGRMSEWDDTPVIESIDLYHKRPNEPK